MVKKPRKIAIWNALALICLVKTAAYAQNIMVIMKIIVNTAMILISSVM